ncbi:MAG: hypothetical protein ACRDT6_02670 [Micromonosporaceae bacterium]
MPTTGTTLRHLRVRLMPHRATVLLWLRIGASLILLGTVWICRPRRFTGRVILAIVGLTLYHIWRDTSGNLAIERAYLAMLPR